MSKKTIGLVLLVVGADLLVVSLFADVFGLGAVAGMGWKQLSGAAAGIIVMTAGVWLARGKAESTVLMVVGAELLVVSLFADVLGLGASAVMGWKQLLGAATGIHAMAAGAWLARGKSESLALIVAGLVLLVVSLFADVFGLGNRTIFGWKQLLGVAAGILTVAAGAWLTRGISKDKS